MTVESDNNSQNNEQADPHALPYVDTNLDQKVQLAHNELEVALEHGEVIIGGTM